MASYQLRAMSVGEILDAGLAIYRDFFGTLVSIVIVCQGVPTVMNVYATLGGGVENHPVLAIAANVNMRFRNIVTLPWLEMGELPALAHR